MDAKNLVLKKIMLNLATAFIAVISAIIGYKAQKKKR